MRLVERLGTEHSEKFSLKAEEAAKQDMLQLTLLPGHFQVTYNYLSRSTYAGGNGLGQACIVRLRGLRLSWRESLYHGWCYPEALHLK